MRMTEGLTKVFYSRAIAKGRTKQLNAAMEKYLNLKDRIKEVEVSGGKKAWKRMAFKGYECITFSKPLACEGTFQAETAIERVLHEVFPPSEIQSSTGAGAGKVQRPRKATPKEQRREANSDFSNETPQQEARFTELSCHLWRRFHVVTKQMRSKNPNDPALQTFGQTCRDLGARWCMFMPRNRCSSLYLHTLMMHGGQFMSYLLERGLTIGMLENSGAERRHQIGKLHFRKSLGGGGTLYFAMTGAENRSAYLTLRGLLIWQYGRDLLAYYLMLDEMDKSAQKAKGARISGWAAAVEQRIGTQGVEDADSVQRRTRELRGLMPSQGVLDDQQQVHEDLTEDHLALLEGAIDQNDERINEVIEAIYQPSAAPVVVIGGKGGNNAGYVDPGHPIVMATGQFIADIDGTYGRDTGSQGSSSEEEGSDIDRSVNHSADDDDDCERQEMEED